jgi:hypothetical protein
MVYQLGIFLLVACLFLLIRGSGALWAMALLSFSQLVVILLPFALAVVVLSPLADRNHNLLIRCFGFRPYILFISFSTILHEASHAIMCVVFGHRIVRFKALPTGSEEGEAGLVQHGWNSRSIYQSIGNFFIGVAPMIVGILVIYVLTTLCFPEFCSWHYSLLRGSTHWVDAIRLILPNVAGGMKTLIRPESFTHPGFYAYLAMLLIVGNSIAPSLSDIRNSAIGIGAMGLGLFILNCVLNIAGVSPAKYLKYLFPVMGIGVHIVLILIFAGVITFVVLKGITLVKKPPVLRT